VPANAGLCALPRRSGPALLAEVRRGDSSTLLKIQSRSPKVASCAVCPPLPTSSTELGQRILSVALAAPKRPSSVYVPVGHGVSPGVGAQLPRVPSLAHVAPYRSSVVSTTTVWSARGTSVLPQCVLPQSVCRTIQ